MRPGQRVDAGPARMPKRKRRLKSDCPCAYCRAARGGGGLIRVTYPDWSSTPKSSANTRDTADTVTGARVPAGAPGRVSQLGREQAVAPRPQVSGQNT